MTHELAFLRYIREPLVCVMDGIELAYESGDAALQSFKVQKGFFVVESVSVRNGRIVVAVQDRTLRIQTENQAWIEKLTEEAGVAPSLFDGS